MNNFEDTIKVSIICEQIPDKGCHDKGAFVCNCTTDTNYIPKLDKPIIGHISEYGENYPFRAIPLNTHHLMQWDGDYPPSSLVGLGYEPLDKDSIKSGVYLTRFDPSGDEYDYKVIRAQYEQVPGKLSSWMKALAM